MRNLVIAIAIAVLLAAPAMAGDSTKVELKKVTTAEKIEKPDSLKVKLESVKKADTAKVNEAPKLKLEPQKLGEKVKIKEPEWVTNESGLKWRDWVVGEGDEAKKGNKVSVHYTGWLWEDGKKGTKFDSSHDRAQAFEFPLGYGRVIKGWDEGVAGMKIGGTRELLIPANLGYGDRGAGKVIPPGATLLFKVELLGVGKGN